MKYYELAEYRVSNRNRVIRSENIHAITVEKGATSPLFRSVFWYTDDILAWLKAKHSVARYNGIRGISYIPIDIDKKSNSDTFTLSKLRDFIEKLSVLSLTHENYQIYFSGTGYHIFIDNDVFGFEPHVDLPMQLSLTLRNLDLIDDNAIMRGAQLIRIEHSLNEKSGLFKIPLTYEEAMTLEAEAILELAKTQRLDFVYEETHGKLQLEKYIVTPQQFDSQDVVMQKEAKFNNMYAMCIQSLWERGPVEGERNNTVLRLASHWKRQGIPEEAAIASINAWNKKGIASLDPKVIEKKVTTVYHSPYRYGCNDPLLQKYCDRRCIFYKSKSLDEKPLSNVDDLDAALLEHIEMREHGEDYINLKHTFGLAEDCILYPGEFVIFQGDTGINKTSIIQNIMLGVDMVNDVVRPPGVSIIYYGPELTAGQIHLRDYCIVSGWTENDVFLHFDNGLRKYRSALEHVAVQNGSMTMEEIEHMIVDKQPQVLIIDYLEQVDHPSWDRSPTIAVAQISKGLSTMAKKYNIVIIGISQINRESSKSGVTTVHSGFGSGAIEKSARRLFIIEGSQETPYRTISQAKANNDVLWSGVVIERQDNWRFKRIK